LPRLWVDGEGDLPPEDVQALLDSVEEVDIAEPIEDAIPEYDWS